MLEYLARLGYLSKAFIYAIVGLLALMTATHRGGRVTDSTGALKVVLTQPFGHTLLVVLAIGLCGYAVWRLTDAIADPEGRGTDAKGLATRVGVALRGCVYGVLGLNAIQLLRGLSRPQRDEAATWTARFLEIPFGEAMVALAGIGIAAYGAWEAIRSFRGKPDAKLDWSAIAAEVRPVLQSISRFGVAIRGGLMATLGVFLVRAALTHNPNEAAGSRESILRLGGVFEGRWFLAVIAVGLLAYAVHQVVQARCRRIRTVV